MSACVILLIWVYMGLPCKRTALKAEMECISLPEVKPVGFKNAKIEERAFRLVDVTAIQSDDSPK